MARYERLRPANQWGNIYYERPNGERWEPPEKVWALLPDGTEARLDVDFVRQDYAVNDMGNRYTVTSRVPVLKHEWHGAKSIVAVDLVEICVEDEE